MNKISIFSLMTVLSLSHGMHGMETGTGAPQGNPPEKSVKKPFDAKPLEELLLQHKKTAETTAKAAEGKDDQSDEVRAAKEAQQTYEHWNNFHKSFQTRTQKYTKTEEKLNKERKRPTTQVAFSLFATPPASTEQSANEMLTAQARESIAHADLYVEQTKKAAYENSWGKEVRDQLTIAHNNIVAPLVVHALEPVITEGRQSLIRTTATEKRKLQIDKDSEEISACDLKLKKQALENGEVTKKHNEEVKDMGLQSSLVEQFVAMGCRGSKAPECVRLTQMLAATMDSQMKRLHKKETGKDFVPQDTTNKPEQPA